MPAAAVEVEIETMTPAEDPDDLARERAALAAKAGLSTPGPVPEHAVAPDLGGAPSPSARRSWSIGVNCSECSPD